MYEEYISIIYLFSVLTDERLSPAKKRRKIRGSTDPPVGVSAGDVLSADEDNVPHMNKYCLDLSLVVSRQSLHNELETIAGTSDTRCKVLPGSQLTSSISPSNEKSITASRVFFSSLPQSDQSVEVHLNAIVKKDFFNACEQPLLETDQQARRNSVDGDVHESASSVYIDVDASATSDENTIVIITL